jgi:FkbM family methyltransferase
MAVDSVVVCGRVLACTDRNRDAQLEFCNTSNRTSRNCPKSVDANGRGMFRSIVTNSLHEPLAWQPYWRFAARAFKRAIYGRYNTRVLDQSFRLAYEARYATFDGDLSRIATLAQGKKCVFDIGANVGITTLAIASRLSPDGHVYAFDASEACCLVIRENGLLNGLLDKIHIVNAIVAGESGRIHPFNWDFTSGNSSIVMPSLTGRQLPLYKSALSIDDFAESTQTSPDFIKVDVEGAELDVLRGMQRVLSCSKPIVWIEFHAWPGVILTERIEEAIEILNSVDYEALEPKSGQAILRSKEYIATNGGHFTRTYALLRPRRCAQ